MNEKVWRDIVDNEELDAWASETSTHTGANADDLSDFGEWVDSSDSIYGCSKSSLHVSDGLQPLNSYAPESYASTITREPASVRSPDYASISHDALDIRISSNSMLEASSLHSNPWLEMEPHEGRSASYGDGIEDGSDYDPEIDSAMAFSEWENARTMVATTQDDSDLDVNDEDDAMYVAWDMEQQVTSPPPDLAEDVAYLTTRLSGSDTYNTDPDDRSNERHSAPLQHASEKRARHRDRQSLQLRWMRRLTGSVPTRGS